MAFRVLLRGASTMIREDETNCSSLHHITDLSSPENQNGCAIDSKTKEKTYKGCYWSVFCLQTHLKHQQSLCVKFTEDICCISSVLIVFFTIIEKTHGKFNEMKCKQEESKELTENESTISHLLHSLFSRLSFVSYYRKKSFDIRKWVSLVEVVCKLSLAQRETIKVRSPKEILSEEPTMVLHCLEMLLLHHTMQCRTNSQAIFKLSKVENLSDSSNIIESISQNRLATAFFPTTSLLNHSCSPNTILVFIGRNIKVVAAAQISEGEEVLHCYGPQVGSHSLAERQKILSEQYFFDCRCMYCIEEGAEDEEEKTFYLQFSAFKCIYCSDPVKKEEGSGEGVCINVHCCGTQDLEKPKNVYQISKALYKKASLQLGNGDFDCAMENYTQCLKQMESVMYHNSKDIGEIHDQLAKCFIMQGQYEKAIPHLCKSITIVGICHGARSIQMAGELQKLASVYFNAGSYAHAATQARKVVSIYEKYYRDSDNYPEGTLTMRRIVDFYDKMKKQ